MRPFPGCAGTAAKPPSLPGYGPGSLSLDHADEVNLRCAHATGGTSSKSASQRVVVGLAGADAHRVIDRCDENLAVADLAGARA